MHREVVLNVCYAHTDVDRFVEVMARSRVRRTNLLPAYDPGRFVEGVMARARVRHTNLIPVYDIGLTDDGQLLPIWGRVPRPA